MKTIAEYKKIVKKYHEEGHSCSQSTALAFNELVSIEGKTLYSLLEGFGAGMGNKEGTCGAATGCISILSLLASSGDIENPSKKDTYKISSYFMEEFLKKNKATICKTIKGEDKNPIVPLVSCADAIDNAVEILFNTIVKYDLV